MKYWIESSYKFEDKKKEFEECLIVAVDYGDKGTETIATFGMDNFSELTTLITHLNKEKEMKYNDEIVGEQYEIRELVIINFIEWYASEEEDREPLRQAMQLYLQQELWVDFEGMKLKDTREKGE
tara:strand:- start:155 stop:529 length:375 start_codon:yes stop_codon:yes gene_type:complete